MIYQLAIDPEAQTEFDEGYDFYEGEQSGLGEEFGDAVEVVLKRITKMPRLHSLVFGRIRKAVVRKFPYCVYYREEDSIVRVISIFFAKRNPSIWQRRATE